MGRPSRGAKATAGILFLDALYRDAASKVGITYVDVWDGFVDEAGRFLQQGPDFEGQIRRLRSYDGVFFTKAGARKLAHYVEREITRLLASRSAPITLPSESGTPDANALPGQPAPRPLAGPIIPLVASSVGTDQLLGGPGAAFTGLLASNGIAISMDGKGAWRDNVFVERLWRSVKYEEVYLHAYESVGEARNSIGFISISTTAHQNTHLAMCLKRRGFAGRDAILRGILDSAGPVP